MESLSELIPGLGDAIRIGRLSYQLGEMLANYFSKENETDTSNVVSWRKIAVFNKEYSYLKFTDSALFIISGVLTLGALWIVTLLFALIQYLFCRGPIIAIAEDIEVTDSRYKMLRNKKGEMGLCRYNIDGFTLDYSDKLLLRCEYKILKGFRNSYIVQDKSGKYGLYNAELQVFVAKCEYDLIAIYSQNTYLYTKGDVISLMNEKGDRV